MTASFSSSEASDEAVSGSNDPVRTRSGERTLVTLRRVIATGELAAGSRITEIALADRLGVSRMPVRLAVRALAQEGMLIGAGARGFAVRSVSAAEIVDAAEVRAVLEGLAARLLAERGAGPATMAALASCLADGDALLEAGRFEEEDAPAYLAMNVRFHAAVLEGAGNAAIGEALARNDHLPFASIAAMVIDRDALTAEYRRLRYAHTQHHAVVDAIARRQGARAEALMREHAHAVLALLPMLNMGSGVTVVRHEEE